MFAASDVTTASGVVASEAARREEISASEDPNKKQIWRFIYLDMSYVKSLYGILVAAEWGLSLIALICVSIPKNEGCAYLYSSSYSYFEFVASSCFIISLIWYILYAISITTKLSFVRWDIAEIAWLGFYIINYFIASAVLASRTCSQGGYGAAAVFGFMCFAALGAHEFFEIRAFIEKRNSSGRQTTTTAQGEQVDDESKY